jgi:hypothetical protein
MGSHAAVTDLISPAEVQHQVNQSTREILAFVEANKIAVTDLPSLERARQVRTAIGEKQRAVLMQLAQPKKWADSLHKWFCSLEKAALAPLTILDGYESAQIRAFNDAQQRLREDRERAIAEARRFADQARATAEAAALERAGEHALAAAVVEEAIAAPSPVVVLQDDVRAVQSFRRTWKYEVVDLALVPREFLVVDLAKLGSYARAMKDSANVPGVRFFYTDDPIR